jgi:hypothetical protein
MALGNYFVWDHAKYNYNWHIDGADPLREREARRELALVMKKLGWPDHYFNVQLFDEELGPAGD